jgi:hypothetical protein
MTKKVSGGMGISNIIIIILLIILLLGIVWYVYTTFFSGTQSIQSSPINMNASPPPPPILASTFTNPTSTKYSYGFWIYVNSWDTNKNKVIISRYNDILIYLDKISGVLNCAVNSSQHPYYNTVPTADVVMDPSQLSSSYMTTTNMITVTNNFPLQTWVYVVVSVNNTIADIYLNGKMVKSIIIEQVNPDKSSNLFYGNGYDAVVSGVTRWSTSVDPNLVWNTYVNGTSANSMSSLLGNGYHASVTITKNNATTSQFSLF